MRWEYALKTVILETLSPHEMREFELYLQGFGDEGFEIVAFHLLPRQERMLAVVLLKRQRSGGPRAAPHAAPASDTGAS